MPKAVLGHNEEFFPQKSGLLQNAENVVFVTNEFFQTKTAYSIVLKCTQFINKGKLFNVIKKI